MSEEGAIRNVEKSEIVNRKRGLRDVSSGSEGVDVCLGVASRETFTRWLTPIQDHFVLHRANTPELDAESWRVSISGAVETEGELSVDTLRDEFPSISIPHTMECAGNCRAYFEPSIDSVAWEFDAASTAIWTGAPLESVLSAYGAEMGDSMWVTAFGADDPKDGDDMFARSIPMSKIRQDCILSYEMNGEELPVEHGHPIRLIVPGWYGVNSVKWIDELRVMDKMVYGPEWDQRRSDDRYYTRWQQDRYRIAPEDANVKHHPSISIVDTWEQQMSDEIEYPYTFDQNVMSVIGYPSGTDPVRPRSDGLIEIVGMAWAGDDDVETVEISTDGGETWNEGRFIGPGIPNAWRLFRYMWNAEAGTHRIVSRATDEHGRRQPEIVGHPDDGFSSKDPDRFPWNRRGYAGNAYMPLATSVEVLDSE